MYKSVCSENLWKLWGHKNMQLKLVSFMQTQGLNKKLAPFFSSHSLEKIILRAKIKQDVWGNENCLIYGHFIHTIIVPRLPPKLMPLYERMFDPQLICGNEILICKQEKSHEKNVHLWCDMIFRIKLSIKRRVHPNIFIYSPFTYPQVISYFYEVIFFNTEDVLKNYRNL